LDFITQQHENVLLIPSRALRFQPSEQQLTALRERRRPQDSRRPADPAGSDSTASATSGAAPHEGRTRPEDAAMVWYLDAGGNLAPAPLRTGLADASNTEVLASPVLTDGMKVIVGLADESTESASSNEGRPRRFGPPRF
jgi:hypothetical protein